MDENLQFSRIQKLGVPTAKLSVFSSTVVTTRSGHIYLLTCTLDSFLFSIHYTLDKILIAGQVSLPTYPVSSYFYDSPSDTLFVGTVRGDVLSFPKFQERHFRNLCQHTSSLSPDIKKLIHVIWKEGQNLYTIHHDRYILSWPQKADDMNQEMQPFKNKVYCCTYLKQKTINSNRPILAVVFNDKKAPWLLRSIKDYESTYNELETNKCSIQSFTYAQTSNISFCSVTGQYLATATLDNLLNIFQARPMPTSNRLFFASLLFKVEFKERIIHLAFNEIRCNGGILAVSTAQTITIIDVKERRNLCKYYSKKVINWIAEFVDKDIFVTMNWYDPYLIEEQPSRSEAPVCRLVRLKNLENQ